MRITRSLLPMIFAAALAACHSRPQAGPCEKVQSRQWPLLFGYTKKRIPNCPKIVEVKLPCEKPIKVVQPSRVTPPSKTGPTVDPIEIFKNEFNEAVKLLALDKTKKQLKKKKLYGELKAAKDNFEKKPTMKNGSKLAEVLEKAYKALNGKKGHRNIRSGMKPGMKPGMGTKPGGMKIKI